MLSNIYEMLPNTYIQHIYPHIYVGYICWTYMLDAFSGSLYMLGNMYICWVTCSPTYMKCYPTYIGPLKCYPTYIKSYMLDNIYNLDMSYMLGNMVIYMLGNNFMYMLGIYVGYVGHICWTTTNMCWTTS